MPNWCYNRATFTHEDPEQITRLINAAKVGKLLNEFYPMPPELLEEAPIGDDYEQKRDAIVARNVQEFGYPSWYEWSIDNWGTKWDISEVDEDYMEKSKDGKTVSFSFDTAWAPPTEWYDNIEGFLIEAFYHEPGVGFCGKWTSEDGDDQYEIDMMEDIEDVKERIPSDILDEFGILDDMEMYQEENQDEDELGDIDDAEDGPDEVEEGE
jgi:hypothetical protein